MLADDSPVKPLAAEVAALLHAEKPFDAAKLVAKWVTETSGAKVANPVKKDEAYTLLNILLHWLLDNGAPEEAAEMLWGSSQFNPRPESTRRVWKAFDEHNFILLMGGGSTSKSFSCAVRLFLEWIRDPEFTTIKVLGPSETHLEDNLFTHLVSLHKSATIPMPGTVGKLFIGLDTRARKGSIVGLVIPLGQKSAGRLQGVKRGPRKVPHPIFGPLSRMFVFLDEIANIPRGIHRDLDNIMSNTEGNGLKVIGAFNPTDINDHIGQRCVPPFGWPAFDPDVHYEWTSTLGWFVVRLDPARCENVITGKVIYPGLQTLEGFNQIILSSGGTNSPGYWSMARGCFPPMGTVLSLIPQGMLTEFKGEFIWHEVPRPVGGVDLALEGSDSAKFASGKWGLATGIKFPPSLIHPVGHTLMFKNQKGRAYPRYALQLEQIFPLPKGNTVEMKAAIVKMCQTLGITPEFLAVDRTGCGQGVYDLLRHEWGIGVIGVNFSEKPAERKIMVEDSDTANNLYSRKDSELWFALRKFIEFAYFKASPGMDTADLYSQITGRLFRATGKDSKVESKVDYRSRNAGKSPDDADAVTLLVEAARRASGVTPGMLWENTVGADSGEDDDYYSDNSDHRVDVTNQWATLDL